MKRLLGPLCVAAALLVVPQPSSAATWPAPDPATWTNAQLASQLVFAGVPMSNLAMAESYARSGVGGVVLFGTPPRDLGARLARVRAAGAVVSPLVASDEEGGRVQRLAPVIYPLPSAETVGRTRTPAQAQSLAYDYSRRMRALGVDMALAPVADLGIRGYYMESLDRAFSANPSTAGQYATAWHRGAAAARVAAVVKHWPGHGQATDTHTGAATTPPLSTLEARDMVPFRAAFSAGVPAVMVGHLNVPGLTERGVPASLSPNAMRYLREQAGNRLIVTDSLSMGAVTTALGLSVPEAAVRSLRAGADMAMINSAVPETLARVRAAVDRGELPRAAAIDRVRRVLAVKRLVGQTHHPVGGLDHPRRVPGGLELTGWTIDPDTTAPIRAHLYVDGQARASVLADVERADVARYYPDYGGRHGYRAVVTVPAGRHTVCAYGINVGAGVNARTACRTVDVASAPIGLVEAVRPVAGGADVSGWAIDPDTADPIRVHVYVDGRPVASLLADVPRADLAQRYPAYGDRHGFATRVGATAGTHTVCVYAINAGAGSGNPRLGCATVTVG